MRGKKSDPEFVSKFIQESVQAGCETPEQIVNRAKTQIEQIDAEIRSIEAKKATRSKLLDVIIGFEKPVKDKSEDAKLLPFFEFKYPEQCKNICWCLKHEADTLPVNSWAASPMGPDATEHNFSVKQMLEAKVIDRVSDVIIRGERFDEYWKFVLRED